MEQEPAYVNLYYCIANHSPFASRHKAATPSPATSNLRAGRRQRTAPGIPPRPTGNAYVESALISSLGLTIELDQAYATRCTGVRHSGTCQRGRASHISRESRLFAARTTLANATNLPPQTAIDRLVRGLGGDDHVTLTLSANVREAAPSCMAPLLRLRGSPLRSTRPRASGTRRIAQSSSGRPPGTHWRFRTGRSTARS